MRFDSVSGVLCGLAPGRGYHPRWFPHPHPIAPPDPSLRMLIHGFLALVPLVAPTFQGEADAPEVTQEELEAWTKEIQAEVEELRGAKFRRPVPVAVSDEATLMEYVQKREDMLESPEVRAANVTVAKMLGAMPADMDFEAEIRALLEGQVGGFYDPETKGFYLMKSFTGGLARSILAHELTHALDDQLFGIDATLEARKGNADAQWAFQAVVEGSGTAVGNAWTAKYGKLSPEEMMEQASMGMDVLKDAIPYIYKPLLGSYLRGLLFLSRANSLMEMAMGGKEPTQDAYAQCFGAPPLSSEQVLHPAKYWDPDLRDDPVELTLELEGMPEGWSPILEQTQGELGWALILEDPAKRTGLSSPMAVMGVVYTRASSAGWGGDRYVLLGKGDARVLVARTIWDSGADAEEFLAALDERAEFLRSSAKATADARGLEGSGFEFGAVGERGARLLVWIGTGADEARAVDAAVKSRVGETGEE